MLCYVALAPPPRHQHPRCFHYLGDHLLLVSGVLFNCVQQTTQYKPYCVTKCMLIVCMLSICECFICDLCLAIRNQNSLTFETQYTYLRYYSTFVRWLYTCTNCGAYYSECGIASKQWNLFTTDTFVEQRIFIYNSAFVERLFCRQTVHLGPGHCITVGLSSRVLAFHIVEE